MRGQRDVTRVAKVDLPVVDRGDLPGGGADLARTQRLAPLVEEVSERAGPMNR